MSTLLNICSHCHGAAFNSQACATFLRTWLTILSLFTKPFAFVIFFSVGQMYIKPGFVWWTTTNPEIYRVADGHF